MGLAPCVEMLMVNLPRRKILGNKISPAFALPTILIRALLGFAFTIAWLVATSFVAATIKSAFSTSLLSNILLWHRMDCCLAQFSKPSVSVGLTTVIRFVYCVKTL